jgi:hypothetical protein
MSIPLKGVIKKREDGFPLAFFIFFLFPPLGAGVNVRQAAEIAPVNHGKLIRVIFAMISQRTYFNVKEAI